MEHEGNECGAHEEVDDRLNGEMKDEDKAEFEKTLVMLLMLFKF